MDSFAAALAPRPSSFALPLAEGDAGTAETVREMCRLVNEGSKDPDVNRLAIAIVRQAGVPEFDFAGERRAIFRWFRRSIRFLRDIEGKETLRAARETLAIGMGDCDCQTIAQLALLKSIGQRTRIVTVATHPQAPEQFSHVFPEVRDERGRWIPVDTARKKSRFGLAPRSWFRRYAWDTETCEAVNLDDPQAAAEFDEDSVGALAGLGAPLRWGLRGLGQQHHGARTTYRTAMRAARRGRFAGLRGLGRLGQDDDTGFDWSQLETEIPSIITSTTGLVAASRANPTTLATSMLAPQAQTALINAEAGEASLASIPSWVWLAGAGVIVLVLVSKGRGNR